MTWHLKDRELEKKLIAIDCEFLDNLNDAVKEKIKEFSSDCLEEGDLITLMFCRDSQIELGKLYFLFSELEEVLEYNPKAWNDSRKVEPPRNVLFRANIHRKGFAGEEWVKHKCILHDGYAWKEVDNFKPWGEIIKLDFDEWIEFRPWED